MKQLETDVVVIGAGGAGLAAAISATQGRVKTIVLEKASKTGGTSNMAEGLFAVESRLQRIRQITLTRDEAFKKLMDFTHWRSNARLAKVYIDKSASTIDWLENLGVEFSDVVTLHPGHEHTWHVAKPPKGVLEIGTWAAIIKILTDRVKELGGRIFLQTSAKKIIKKDNRIVGVIAEDSSGEDIQANAKAVIVSTGGFSDNLEWMKKYTGYEYGRDLFSMRIPGVVGDGIRMVWEVGGAQGEMIQQHYASGPSSKQMHAVGFAFNQPNLAVNLLGERFMDEEIMVKNLNFAGNAIARQKNRCGYMIFDGATKKYYEETGLDFTGYGRPYIKASNFDAELKKALDRGPDETFVVIIADSIDELASKTGVNLDTLRKTIDEYNKACETGRDELFGRNARYLRPVKQPKFYAKKLVINSMGTLGGININHKTEVLTKDFNVIPGLYAAGNDANSLYGVDYPFPLPGNTMGFTINSGRIAGENALEYIKSLGK